MDFELKGPKIMNMEEFKLDKSITLNDNEKKKLYSDIKRIALPIAAQSLIGTSLNFVDNIMVGSLGEVELAAVGVGLQIYLIYWMFIFGFTSGCSTFLAQFWGAKDIKNVKKTLGFSLTFSVLVGVSFFIGCRFFSTEIVSIFTNIPEIIVLAAEYTKAAAFALFFVSITQPLYVALRATHQTKLPLYMSIVAFVTNTFLNYMLIFGNFGAPKLGVEGAAVATAISRLLELSVVLIIVFGRKNVIAGTPKEYIGWNKNYLGRITKNAYPTIINEVCWGIGRALFVAAYARIGVTEFAAVRAGDIIYDIFIMASFSIGDAALILIGQKIGEGKLNKVYPMAKILVKIGIIIGIVMGSLMVVFANPLLGLLDNFSKEGIDLAFIIIIIYAVFFPLNIFNGMMITGILRSGGDTRAAMFIEVGTMYIIAVPLVFITALWIGLPVYIVVLFVKLEETFKGIILIKRLKSGKWIRNVINNMEVKEK